MKSDVCRTRVLHPYPGLGWSEVRAAAVEFAEHGWPVLPGTFRLQGHDGWLGKRGGTAGLEPVARSWGASATTDGDEALDVWTRRPFSVLLLCGLGIDVLEIPAAAGPAAQHYLNEAEQLGPIALATARNWLLFVRGSAALRADLAERGHIQHRGVGDWAPLPPTMDGPLPYRWRVTPASVNWRLPSSDDVQQVLDDHLLDLVPRQLAASAP